MDSERLYIGLCSRTQSFLPELNPFQLFSVPVPPLSSITHTHTHTKITIPTGCLSPYVLRWLTHTINYRLLFDPSQTPKCYKSSDFDHFQHQFGLPHTKFSNHCWNFSLLLPSTGLTTVIRGTLQALVQ